MIVTKAHRRNIYEQLFKEGVLVAEKDYNKPKHMELDVPNLQVIKICQSLTSRGYVKTQFSWMYYYYVLTNEGIDYLREWLHLPAEIVPATHKKQARTAPPSMSRGPPRGDGTYRAPRGPGGDEGYRRRGADDKVGASGDFRPRFAGGVGRGAPSA